MHKHTNTRENQCRSVDAETLSAQRLLNMPTPRLQSQTGTDDSKVHFHARVHTSRSQLMHSHPGFVTTLTQRTGCDNLHRLQGRGCRQAFKFEQRNRIRWVGNYVPCHVGFYNDTHTDQCTCGPPRSLTAQLAKWSSEADSQQEITFFTLWFQQSLQRQL